MNSKSLGERIARQVVRGFYDDVHVVVFDGLLLETAQPVNDTDLAQHLSLPPKLVRTCLQALKRDGFVQERSQRQAANAKKATIFLWSFSSERFARIFRYRMLMIRKRANALASQAIADETFICSSTECFYHTQNLSTIEAIQACRRLGVTDFICEQCRSPLTKQTRTTSLNYEDLKSRINQQMMAIESLVSQLVHLIAQERAEQAAQSEAPSEQRQDGTAAGLESVQVHIESHDAMHAKTVAALGAGPAASSSNTTRTKATPWETNRVVDEQDLLEDAEHDEKLDVTAFEEILRRQEMELTQPVKHEIKAERPVDRHHRHHHGDEHFDSVMVMIRGQPVPLSSVTEEMAQNMTNEEYRAYEHLLSSTDLYHDEFDF